MPRPQFPTPTWRFRPSPVDGGRTGGDQAAMNFEHDLEVFVREVIQNSLDARLLGGPPIRVVFEMDELRGRARDAFLAALDWDRLREHAIAAAKLAPSLRAAILRMEASDQPIPVLTIHDGPAVGLSGPERGGGRFAMFARNKLMSDKQSDDAGGSFGLGKSVLWAFSGLSTVMVQSAPLEQEPGTPAERCVGVAQFPWHEVGGKSFDGPGWFGVEQREASGSWSASFDAGSERLAALRLTRGAELRSGTSLVIPDFQAEASVAETLAAIEAAAAKWFWPAMAGEERLLEVAVRGAGEDRVVDPRARRDLLPFLHLAGLETRGAWQPATVTGHEPLKLPAVADAMRDEPGFTSHPAKSVREAIRVDALALDDDPGELSRSLAMLRGARMVVRYEPLRADQPVFALARAGTARGQEESDHLVEQFLRHAEPPSHDDWAASAPKLHDRYKRGYKGELNGLRKRLKDAALVLLKKQEQARGEQEVPAALRKILSIPAGSGAGDKAARGRFDYRITECALVADAKTPAWSFAGEVHCSHEGAWILHAEAWLDGDGRKLALPVEELRANEGEERSLPRGVLLPGPGRYRFRGMCPLGGAGELASHAVFGVHLRRKPARGDLQRSLFDVGSANPETPEVDA